MEVLSKDWDGYNVMNYIHVSDAQGHNIQNFSNYAGSLLVVCTENLLKMVIIRDAQLLIMTMSRNIEYHYIVLIFSAVGKNGS